MKKNHVWVVEILQANSDKWAVWDVSDHHVNEKVAKGTLKFWQERKENAGAKFRLRKYVAQE